MKQKFARAILETFNFAVGFGLPVVAIIGLIAIGIIDPINIVLIAAFFVVVGLAVGVALWAENVLYPEDSEKPDSTGWRVINRDDNGNPITWGKA